MALNNADVPRSKPGMHPHSLANLQHGKSPGRPKKPNCLLDCLREELQKRNPETGLTNEQTIAGVLIGKAAGGNIKAIELMMSYLHAKPAQAVDLNPNGPLTIKVVYDDSNSARNNGTPTPPAQ